MEILTIPELNEKIYNWAEARGLIANSDFTSQTLKTYEEASELVLGISKNNLPLIKDSIGDIYVTLIIGLAQQFDHDSLFDLLNQIDADNAKPTDYSNYHKTDLICQLFELIHRYYKDCYYFAKNFRDLVKYLNDLSLLFDTNLENCVSLAYDEIKDRKGKLINGTFVKETDL